MLFDTLIIGGGLAGLCNAIHLSKAGLKVGLIEKNSFPKHKVCGEYISNEVLPYLDFLGIDPFNLGATSIKKFQLSTSKGKIINTNLPLGGFGISRFALDNYLMKRAVESGCVLIRDTVVNILPPVPLKGERLLNISPKNAENTGSPFRETGGKVLTKSNKQYLTRFLIGAFGKRSNLDLQINRNFIQKRAPFLAIKSHFRGEFPNDLVALHNFKGGYCGISKVENELINICYLTNFESFKKYRNIETFQKKVLYQNPNLKTIFENCEPVFEKPLTISQISFLPKKTVENHILMSGDAAGMIHPLCGNGMGMAIQSAQILSTLLIRFFEGKIQNREVLEKEYSKIWQQTFQKRLIAGKVFNAVFSQNKLFEWAISGLTLFPKMLPFFIKQTHGDPLIYDMKYR